MPGRLTLLVSTLCTAFGAGAADLPVRAQLDPSISIAHCLDTIGTPNRRDEARCPGFLTEPLKEARQTCADAGGVLLPEVVALEEGPEAGGAVGELDGEFVAAHVTSS